MKDETMAVEEAEDMAADPQEAVETESEAAKDEVDYSAELEKLKAERDNYKKGLLSAKSQLKEQKENEHLEDKHDVDEIRSVIREEINQLKTELTQKERDAHLSGLTKNDAHKQLVNHYLEEVIKPSGDYKRDVELALALADKGKYQSEAKALKNAVVSQQTASGPEFSGHKRPQPKKDGWNAAEKELLNRYGALK